MSGISFKTAVAAAFIKSSARWSLGFSNSYFAESLEVSMEDEQGDPSWLLLVESLAVDAHHYVRVG